MTARPHTYWQVHCNAPSCGAQDTSEMGASRAQFRKYLARRGWTVKVGDGPLPQRKDYCPGHNPDGSKTEEG